MRKVYQLLKSLGDFVSLQKVKKARRWQVLGMIAGITYSVILVWGLRQPFNEGLLSKGPLTPGHKDLQCSSCHQQAEGTLRQQFQAKAKYAIGFRHTDSDLGLMKVDNASCLSCHNRPDDHHPVFRFNEPRFAEVRKTLDVTQCGTCHTEHTGTLASVLQTSTCLNCHQDLKIKNDPLEISHEQLIANPLDITCMQCHDYHGNHKMTVVTSIKDTIATQAILEYLRTGADPYATQKIIEATTKNEK